MVLIFGYFIKYFMYLIHIQIGKTLGEHYVPCTRFLDWKTLVNLNVFKGYQNLLNLLNTLCIYVISQVYSQVGNNPLFPVCTLYVSWHNWSVHNIPSQLAALLVVD